MHLLIQHGTWLVIPIGLVLSFLYLLVYPRVFPSLLMHSLAEEDARKVAQAVKPEKASRAVRPVAFKDPAAAKPRS